MPTDVPALLRRFWHPVATLEQLWDTPGGRGPLPVELCGERVVVADLGEGPVALADRCPHRSTKLSLGWVDGAALQCAYHGWRWAGDGRCVGVPTLPGATAGSGLPAKRVPAYEAEVRYGLLWVRLEPGWPTRIPDFPAYDDERMKAVMGAPYEWPISAERRLENATDLPHLAWVHDGTLADRRHPEVPHAPVRREQATLRFSFVPPVVPEQDPRALVGPSDYVISLPSTVDITFEVPGVGRRSLWICASPIDAGRCRSFWFTSRSDDHDGDDAPHLAFQQLVLDEDEPVVSAQDPPWIPWEGALKEVSVGTDAVSLAYRRFLLDAAACDTPEQLAVLLDAVPARPLDDSSRSSARGLVAAAGGDTRA